MDTLQVFADWRGFLRSRIAGSMFLNHLKASGSPARVSKWDSPHAEYLLRVLFLGFTVLMRYHYQ